MMVIPVASGLALFALAYSIWRKEDIAWKKLFWPAFLFKLFCGVALGLVYTFYYTVGDTALYYADGVRLANLARADLTTYLTFLVSGDDSYAIWNQLLYTEGRALFMSKVTSFFCLLTADEYYLVSLYFSFFSFYGAWTLTKLISRHWPGFQPAAIVGFLFFPSISFWTSGVIKESLAMACVYALLSVCIKLWKNEKLSIGMWMLTPLCIWFLIVLKYYFAAVFIPVFSTALVVHLIIQPRFPACHGLKGFVVWLIVFLIPVYAASVIHPNFYPERFLEVIVSNNHEFVAISEPTDLIDFDGLQPTVGSIVAYAPKALISGLFRPFPWECNTLFQVLVSIENLVLLALLVSSFRNWKDVLRAPDRMLVFSLIVYVVLLCIFLTLSTPNFGTLSRYRVGFLPFFFLLIGGNNPLLQRLQPFIQR